MRFTHPILLFYKYTRIAEPARFAAEQRALCESLALKGRVLVAHEGINGTLGGEPDKIARYCAEMRRDERLADLEFKWSEGSADTFPKLVVKARREIVSLSLAEDVDVSASRATHLSPRSGKPAWRARGPKWCCSMSATATSRRPADSRAPSRRPSRTSANCLECWAIGNT